MKLGIIATQIADDAGIASFFDDVPAMRSDMKELGTLDFGRKTAALARPVGKTGAARSGAVDSAKRPTRVAPAKSARRRP